jgi:CheY-like chemotaxis protein
LKGRYDVIRKILIVDDSKLARMAVAKALNGLMSEWTRLEATNAEEALALVGSQGADIALLDFNMPGRDGLELARDLKALDPTMPIAVVSANLQHEVVENARKVGASFLPKPVSEPALRAFLDEAGAQLTAARKPG